MLHRRQARNAQCSVGMLRKIRGLAPFRYVQQLLPSSVRP